MNDEQAAQLKGFQVHDPVDPFENRAGPFFYRVDSDGKPVFALAAERRHCNTYNIVHGGLMMTLIDLTMVAAAKEHRTEQFVTVSLNSESWPRATRATVFARGELIQHRSLAFVRGVIEVDGNDLRGERGVKGCPSSLVEHPFMHLPVSQRNGYNGKCDDITHVNQCPAPFDR